MASNRRVAVVGPIPPPNGGMAMQTAQLVRLLSEHNVDVRLIPVNSPYKPAFIKNIPVLRAVFRLIAYVLTLYREIKQVDVVHIMANSGWSFYLFAMPAIYIASFLNKPSIINYRGGKARQFFQQSWKRIKPAMNKVSQVTVPSKFLAEVFAEYNVDAKVVPNIIDLSLFEYKPPQETLDAIHIIVTRNLEEIYDNETALRAFAIVQQQFPLARLTIAGSGPLKEQLIAVAKELNIADSVRFPGRLDRQAMAQLYQSADIMLNASTIDNMPNSILEAQASGVLVVSSNVGGIPYMVSDGRNALLVEPRQPNKMAEAVIEVLEDSALRDSLSRCGRDNVTLFSPEEVIPQWLAIYKGAK